MSKTNVVEKQEQTGYTPGPWEYSRTSSDDDRFDIYQADTAWTVARTVNNVHVDCREANARLIAAAPELLEACKMLLRWCELENQDEPDIEELTLQTVHEHVEAAIARAEGGAS